MTSDASTRRAVYGLSPTPPESQRTLLGVTQCSGMGVHSGTPVTLRLCPAPPDSGIVFVRTDLPAGSNRVPARWDAVVDTRLCTMIANPQGVSVGTVEHVLAALRAMDIDNAVLEIDGPEVPIMDGSAAPFLVLIDLAGVCEQDAPRRWIEITRPVHVTRDGKMATLLPADEARFHVTVDFDHPVIGRQDYVLPLTPADFRNEISRARTFGFVHEVEQLRRIGLARGGSLDNAIVLDTERVLNAEGLRYTDEFVRHKLLDAVGDLSLAGAPIRGSFVSACSGHALNNALLRALFADAKAWRYTTAAAQTQRIAAST